MLRNVLACLVLMLTSLTAQAASTLLVFGDSLSAGYGIRREAAWPSLLQARLTEKRFDYSVANLSISGETTAGGRSRLEASLRQHRPTVVVLALGANDGLRGLPVSQIQDNLGAMIEAARSSGARVLMVGMKLPPNYGPYAAEFEKTFAAVARKQKVPLVDFLLAGIADKPELFQADMLHPTAAAQPQLLDNVWPALLPLLK